MRRQSNGETEFVNWETRKKNRASQAIASTPGATTTADSTVADRIPARDNPNKIGPRIHAGSRLKRHLRPHRVIENHRPEQCRPSRTTRGSNGKNVKRTANTGIAKETIGVATTLTTMRLHRKDHPASSNDTSSIGEGGIEWVQSFQKPEPAPCATPARSTANRSRLAATGHYTPPHGSAGRAAVVLNHLNNLAKKRAGLTGLETKSFIPAARQRCLSSVKAFAVMARIGVSA